MGSLNRLPFYFMIDLNLRKNVPIIHRHLNSGLDVLAIEKKNAPIVTLNLTYNVGSKDEKHGRSGFAHLFEHLMFEGTQSLKKGEFDKYCTIAGGSNNAYTTYDWTTYYMTLPAHQLELGLWLESDRMFNSEITPEALENQQKVVTEEIRQTVENQPYGKWREYLAKASFDSKSAYSWEVHGSIEDVQNATLDDVRKFHKTYYRAENACLVICGDFSSNTALDLAEKYFDKSRNDAPKIVRNEFTSSMRKCPEVVSFEDVVPLAACFVSFHCDGFLNDEIFSADIATNILGAGRSSHLYESLVYEKEIASQVGAFLDKREKTSLITIYAIANSPDTTSDELYETLLETIENKRNKGAFQNEFEKTRNQIITAAAREIQTTAGISDIVSNMMIFWKQPDRLYSLLDKYFNINIDDINSFYHKYLTPDNLVRVDVIPTLESD